MFRFNRCESLNDGGPFVVRVEIGTPEGKHHHTWQQEDFMVKGDLQIAFSALEDYDIRLTLDDSLAYAGQYRASSGLL